jgi:iron complex outermembrane receptor protein
MQQQSLLFGLLVAITSTAFAENVVTVAPISVDSTAEAESTTDSSLGVRTVEPGERPVLQNQTGDTADLLSESPGLTTAANGGISSFPVVQGMADDRLRILVDGVEYTSACPNHMNSPLSYVDPSSVAQLRVFAGVTPVSVGGDSIGGTIQVVPAEPQFAASGTPNLYGGRLGSFYRSNGNAYGYQLRAFAANHWAHLSYSESRSQSDNYLAGGNFKAVTAGREGATPLEGNVVGSTAYRGAVNRSLALALRRGAHLLQAEISRQSVDFEGFPNQRMDMTQNVNRLGVLRYRGQFEWGDLQARAFYQATDHEMNMGPDRYSYGTGMPMLTEGRSRGATLQANVLLSETNTVRAGVDYHHYSLFDWWPPVGSIGSMAPNDFWNVDFGRRQKTDLFTEWEASWGRTWRSLIGVRSDTVTTNSAPVQGYNNSFSDVWVSDALAFNASSRKRMDHNWDMTTLLVHAPQSGVDYTLGYARKSRSPNLYHRYAWSANPMAALMNNFTGDGNGYVGNIDLAPEVAHTVSLTGQWRDKRTQRWEFTLTDHFTYVPNYIDAKRCEAARCGATNSNATGFLLLQYVNQRAELYGIDVSGKVQLASSTKYGTLSTMGLASYLRGRNLSTGDNLYNILPLNVKLRVHYAYQGWATEVELQAVADKSQVSRIRNEVPTDGFSLLHIRGGYRWKNAQLDAAIENVLNRFYSAPLGGAYVGQGSTMTTNGAPWGVVVPGKGRSFNLSFTYSF